VKVVIAGAAGFLGSHLTQAYAERGDAVLGIDNFVSGRRENLAWATAHSSVALLDADIAGTDRAIEHAIEGMGGADIILHFASLASPPFYMQKPIETLRANSAGTERCCELAVRYHARILFASTSEIYGDPLEHPQAETYWGNVNPIGPRACYDEGKRFGEAMVSAYAQTHNVDTRIVRIFNTYGPRMRKDDGRVVTEFLSAAIEGRPLKIAGDGTQTRSFCYVDDLIDGIMRTADCDAARNIPMNLGNPNETTIRELAAIVSEVVGVKPQIAWGEKAIDDPARRKPDITRATKLLGWSPAIDLRDGLRRTVAAF